MGRVGGGRRVSKQNHDSAEKYRWLLVLPLQQGAAPRTFVLHELLRQTSSVTHQMAMQISSVTVQKDDSVQLLKQTPSRHSGLDASHHLHRLELRWLKDWTTRGSPAGETHTETTLALPARLSDHKHNDRRSSLKPTAVKSAAQSGCVPLMPTTTLPTPPKNNTLAC